MVIPILITGMHRSHTSLISHWLLTCGLPFSGELMPPTEDNPKGYFEHLKLVEFHHELMKENGLSIYPQQSVPNMKITNQHINQLHSIVTKNNSTYFVAKDPRITLVMDQLWNKVYPDTFYIFIYRKPEDVIFSCMNRLKREITVNHRLWNPLKHLKLFLRQKKWIRFFCNTAEIYNQHILEAISTLPKEQFIIIDSQTCEYKGTEIIEYLNNAFSLSLKFTPFKHVFNQTFTFHAPRKYLTDQQKSRLYAYYNEFKQQNQFHGD